MSHRQKAAATFAKEPRNAKTTIKGVEITRGSDNVYADFGLGGAKKTEDQTGLVVEIIKAIRRLELTATGSRQAHGHHSAQSFRHDAR